MFTRSVIIHNLVAMKQAQNLAQIVLGCSEAMI